MPDKQTCLNCRWATWNKDRLNNQRGISGKCEVMTTLTFPSALKMSSEPTIWKENPELDCPTWKALESDG